MKAPRLLAAGLGFTFSVSGIIAGCGPDNRTADANRRAESRGTEAREGDSRYVGPQRPQVRAAPADDAEYPPAARRDDPRGPVASRAGRAPAAPVAPPAPGAGTTSATASR